MAQAPPLNVVQVSRAEPSPPQAVRPDWEWRYLPSGSGGRVQRLPLLRSTSTDVIPALPPPPPVMIIPSAERRILMEENEILSSTNNIIMMLHMGGYLKLPRFM